jgi:predicted phosphodiesterase
MRLAILSDIHANIEALRASLGVIGSDRIDRIVCLGDIVGYNADPAACVDAIRACGALCVAGNHDRAVCGQISTAGFSPVAARAVGWTRGRLDDDAIGFLSGLPLTRAIGSDLVAVHGALHPDIGQEMVRLDGEDSRRLSVAALLAHPSGARVGAFGHTHRFGIYEYCAGGLRNWTDDEVVLRDDAAYLINPGSIGQPRTDERRATYLVLDTAARTVSLRRVAYDAFAAFGKTRAAGLLPRGYPVPAAMRPVLRRGALGLRALWDGRGGSREG